MDVACAVIFAVCIFYTTIVSTQLYKSKIQWPKNFTGFKSDPNLNSRIATWSRNVKIMFLCGNPSLVLLNTNGGSDLINEQIVGYCIVVDILDYFVYFVHLELS